MHESNCPVRKVRATQIDDSAALAGRHPRAARRRLRRVLAPATAVLACAAGAPAAAEATPFGLPCSPQRQYANVQLCSTTVMPGHDTAVKSFDGTPLALDVTLPAAPAADLPLVIISHGWGGPRADITQSAPWAEKGYAVLAIDARGFNESCGTEESRSADPAGCEHGWIQLDDPRYELRDTQYLAGVLADENIISPTRIGLYGWSYGGTVSLEGAILKDRVMYQDGSLHPWTSPDGKAMQIAAAAPAYPWTDLVNALIPNGHALDNGITGPTEDLQPTGILKESLNNFLLALGARSGYFAPPGVNPNYDPVTWNEAFSAGEPYEGNPKIEAIEKVMAAHSPYYLDTSEAPAPTLLESGWADDLFPPEETLRLYKRTRALYHNSQMALMLMDYGHPRSQNKPEDGSAYEQRVSDWFAHYLKDEHAVNRLHGIEALTQVCGGPSEGPYYSRSWDGLHPTAVVFRSPAAQSFSSEGGDPAIAQAIDPIYSGLVTGENDCTTTPATDEANTANWSLPPATGAGITLLGAPTVAAKLAISGTYPEVAARLWDVGPDGRQTLVARGLYRPTGSGRVVFQLHANAWHFAAGHIPKLQLLGRDAPYARPSNGKFTITVSRLALRLPVHV